MVRNDGQWKARWIEAPNMELRDPIGAKDL